MAYEQEQSEEVGIPDATGWPAHDDFVVRNGLHLPVRLFSSGATRTNDANRLDVWGFISPEVVHRFSIYMHKHRQQADGGLRASDNWQKGMPKIEYVKSLLRHVYDFWLMSRGKKPLFAPRDTDMEDVACAILFNIQGWLLESVLGRETTEVADGSLRTGPQE
jgi:hypothetical protein